MYRARLLCKNPAYGRHLLSWHVRILALCQKNQTKNLGAGRIHASNPEHLPVLRLKAGTIQNRMRGWSMRPIWNTSLLLRLYAWQFRTEHRDNPQDQFRILSLFKSSTQEHSGTEREDDPLVQLEQLIVFRAPRGDNVEQNTGTIHAGRGSGGEGRGHTNILTLWPYDWPGPEGQVSEN